MNTDPDFLGSSYGLGDHPDRFVSDDLVVVEAEGPALSVDTTLRQATRGRGQVVCVACCSDVVCVATTRGFVLRYHWDEYGNEKVHEVEVVKGTDAQLTHLWLDPTAAHILLATKAQGVPEVQYLHRRWTRARPVTKLRGTHLTALAWPPPPPDLLAGGPSTDARSSTGAGNLGATALSDACTGAMLLGSDTGLIQELVIDELHASRKDPGAPKQLFDLKDKRKPITGLHQAVCADGALLVLVATPLGLYVLRGPPGDSTPDGLTALYLHSPLQPTLEAMLPSQAQSLPHSQLQTYSVPDDESAALRFGWLVGNVVYHGEVFVGSTTVAAPGNNIGSSNGNATDGSRQPAPARSTTPLSPTSRAASGESLLRNVCALPLMDVGPGPDADSLDLPAAGGVGPEEDIRAMVMTRWHFLVLAGDRLLAINRVSGRCAAQRVFKTPLLTKAIGGDSARVLDGLVVDPVTHTIYLNSDESLYEVQLRQEEQGLWRVFLELQDWDTALKLCASSGQRDTVHAAKAEAAMVARDYDTAATHWAQVVGGQPPFEDITLRLIEAEVPKSLMLFLSTRLGCLSRQDSAQATMLACWVLELQLDLLNNYLLQSGGVVTAEYSTAEAGLQAFLQRHVDVLDPNTTCSLLAGAGRTNELLVYATARSDHAAVLEALLQQPGGAGRALAVLRKPSCPPELLYRFAPGLMAAVPADFVDLCITLRPAPDPRRLVPALLRFTESGAPAEGRAAVLRYVTYAIDALGSTDSAVHDLAAALYTLEEGEDGLLAYITRARGTPGGPPLYDPKYVLRLAAERGKQRAEVKLLCELGMYEDAVRRALRVDVGLAQAVAGSPPEEEVQLRHRLWLAVAQHVVQGGGAAGSSADQAQAIEKAVQLLKEAGGLLKIEDVLPFFPDFVTIDNFKEAICDSLERYNKQIEELKGEMEEATEIAEAVRRDLAALSRRTALVHGTQPCGRCRQPLMDGPLPAAITGLPAGGALPPFLVFPTGVAYHTLCCAADVCDVSAPQMKARVTSLLALIARTNASDDAAQELLHRLHEEVGAEDPRNGSLVVQLVDMPYLSSPADDVELQTWVV